MPPPVLGLVDDGEADRQPKLVRPPNNLVVARQAISPSIDHV
jgi:hypothetical protein